MAPQARILIAGQAPGSKVHASGIAFDDASGERLREWMGVDRKTFYDDSKIAILPMSFCYLLIAKENLVIYRRFNAVRRPGNVTL
jgi:uracil-DNA glycosylase